MLKKSYDDCIAPFLNNALNGALFQNKFFKDAILKPRHHLRSIKNLKLSVMKNLNSTAYSSMIQF